MWRGRLASAAAAAGPAHLLPPPQPQPPAPKKREVVVLGAGVIGVTTAYALARSGCAVTVIDQKVDSHTHRHTYLASP